MSSAGSIAKKAIRWFIIVVAALVVLIGLALIFFSISPGENILKGVAEDQLSASLGQPVKIGRLETNIFSRLVLRNVRIQGAPPDSNVRVLSIDSLRVDYNLWPLFHKELSVKEIVIDSLHMDIQRSTSGAFDLAVLNDTTTKPAGDTASSSSAFTLSLGSARVTHLSVVYDDESLPAAVDIRDGHLAITRIEAGGHDFRLVLSPINVEYDSIPMLATQFDMNGRYAGGLLNVDSLGMLAENMHLSGSGKALLDSTYGLSAHVELAGKPDSLLHRISRRFGIPDITLEDDFSLRAEIGGSIEAPNVSAKLVLPETDLSDTRLQEGIVEARWHADSIAIDSLYLKGFGGTVSGTADVLVDTIPQAQGDLTLSNIDIASLWKYFYHEPSPYTGRLQGMMSIAGKGRDIAGWHIDASIRATKATYKSQPFPDFSATIALSNGAGRVVIEQDEFTIRAQGSFREGNISGSYTADIKRLEPLGEFFDFHELSGAVSASGSFEGTIDNPSLVANVDATGVRYQNFPVDSLTGSFAYQDSILTIDSMRFDGSLDSIDPRHPPFHIDSIAGGFSYGGHISGRLDSLAGKVSVDLRHPGYREYAADSAGADVELAGTDILIDSAWVFRGSDYLHADGRYNIDQVAGSVAVALYGLAVHTDSTAQQTESVSRTLGQSFGKLHVTFNLSDTSAMKIAAAGTEMDVGRMAKMFSDSLHVGGILNFEADFAGTMAAPEGSLDVVATRPYYEGYSLDSITADVRVDTNVVLVKRFASFGAGRRMTAHGSMEIGRDSTGAPVITPTSRTNGQIIADSVQLSTFNPFVTGTALHGLAGLNVTWDGTIQEPHATGSIALDSGKVITAGGIDSVYNIDLRGSLADTTLTIDSASGILLREPFTMHGTVTATEWKRFVADIDIVLQRWGKIVLSGEIAADSVDLMANIDSLELDLVQPFVPDIDSLSGELACRINIKGSPQSVQLFGNVDINNLVVRPSMISTPVTGGVVRVSFNESLITIDTLYARMGGGPIMVSGTLTQKAGEVTDVNLEATVDSVKFSEPKEFTVDVEKARLTYTRQKDYFLLDGDVQMGESRLTMNFPFQSILPWAKSVEHVPTEYPPLLRKTRMNVRVRESRNLWVDNNLAKIRLHTELAVVGTVPQPNLSGQVTIEEGYLIYLDRKFKVETGSAYFSDPVRLNPQINFQATATVTTYQALTSTTYTITISAQGPMDKLRIDITSQPLLDKADILSLLTLGATREELTGKGAGAQEGGAQGILTRRAETLASEQAAGYVAGKIGSLLGLEQVTVQGNLFNLQSENAPRITASKMLSKRVKLTYSTTVGYLNEESIQVGYQLTKRFYLEGQTDRAGESALDIKYRLRFR